MNKIDWIFLLAYFVLIVWIGLSSCKKIKTSSDFFLAGRHFGWPIIGISIVATQVSAITFIGAPSWSYQTGLKAIALFLNLPLVAWIASKTLIPYFYHLNITSIYEYLQLRFGKNLKNILALFYLIKTILIASVIIYVPSLILSRILSFPIEITICLIVLFALFYTTLGGIRSVILSDGLQLLIMWIGLALLLFFLFPLLPLSPQESLSALIAQNKLNALDFSFAFEAPNTVWAGIIGGGIIHLAYYGTEQTQIQRILSAKNLKNARLSLYAGSVINLIQTFLFLVLGLGLYLFYQNNLSFSNPNDALISFVLQEIPQGVLGIFLVAIFAATMSSIDSSINSMTTVFMKDFFDPYLARFAKHNNPILIIRIVGVFLGLLILLLALNLSQSQMSILELITQYASFILGSILGVFLLGIFTQRSNENGAMIGFFAGIIGVIFASTLFSFFWMWNAPIGLMITLIVGYLSSLCFKTQTNHQLPKFHFSWKNLFDFDSLLLFLFCCVFFLFLWLLPSMHLG